MGGEKIGTPSPRKNRASGTESAGLVYDWTSESELSAPTRVIVSVFFLSTPLSLRDIPPNAGRAPEFRGR